MGNFGKIRQLSDLPSDTIIKSYVKDAMVVIDKGVKLPEEKKAIELLEVPEVFNEAFKQNAVANKYYTALSPLQKKRIPAVD